MDTTYPMGELFTKAHIAALTGVDPSTLNYWLREGVLRPSSGGQGKGSHRRFEYHQVTLAALLKELRDFGIAMPSLALIAARFHGACDWMERRGISRANLLRIMDLAQIASAIAREGKWVQPIHDAGDERYFADTPKFHSDRLSWVELDWTAAIAYHLRPEQNWHSGEQPTAAEIALVAGWTTKADVRDFGLQERYFSTITECSYRSLRGHVEEATCFYRDEAGDWQIRESYLDSYKPVSFIAVDMGQINYRLWGAAE